MAGYQVISSVSMVLQELLKHYMDSPVPITLAPPDVTPNQATGHRVNLYLYHINENAALKNQDLPGQSGRHGQPPLALVLYYLLTAYPESESSEIGESEAQNILGDAMSVLHDFPLISRDLLHVLGADGSLRDEVERLKITFHPSTLEDLSKLWTALPKANFRRSVIYEVSAVQIQGQKGRVPRGVPMPVSTRAIHTTLLHRPAIHALYRKPTKPGEVIGDQRARVGDTVTIEGLNFRASKTWVKLGPLDPVLVWPSPVPQAVADFQLISDTKIEIRLPDDTYPRDADHPAGPRALPASMMDRWQPGPHQVQVLTEQETEVVKDGLEPKGTVETSRRQFPSNQAVFMLVPGLISINPKEGHLGTTVTLTGSRLYRPGLKTVVLVGDVSTEVTASAPDASPTHIVITPNLSDPSTHKPLHEAGDHLMRVMVNGAQSIDEITFTVNP